MNTGAVHLEIVMSGERLRMMNGFKDESFYTIVARRMSGSGLIDFHSEHVQ